MTTSSSETPIVAVLGATASGKHALAMALAERFPLEIVSVDSMKVYRGMDIGTAKPGPEHCRLIPHHMIDLTEPDEPYTAARFGREAREVIGAIWERGNLPLLVGGSGLYLRAVLGWIFPGPDADPSLRAALEQQAREHGVENLHRRLFEVDPDTAGGVGLRDLKRIVRALEVYEKTGVPISRLRAEHARSAPPFQRPLLFCLRWDRAALQERIDRRVDFMMQAGWADEVQALRRKTFSPEFPALRALGYATLWAYLDGELDLDEAVTVIQRETRQFARRQMIWFRGMPGLAWLDVPKEGWRGCVEPMASRVEAYLEERGVVLKGVCSPGSPRSDQRKESRNAPVSL